MPFLKKILRTLKTRWWSSSEVEVSQLKFQVGNHNLKPIYKDNLMTKSKSPTLGLSLHQANKAGRRQVQSRGENYPNFNLLPTRQNIECNQSDDSSSDPWYCVLRDEERKETLKVLSE